MRDLLGIFYVLKVKGDQPIERHSCITFYQMNKMIKMATTYSTLSISCTILSVVASRAESTSGRNRPPSLSPPDWDWRCSITDVFEEAEDEEEKGREEEEALLVPVLPCGEKIEEKRRGIEE